MEGTGGQQASGSGTGTGGGGGGGGGPRKNPFEDLRKKMEAAGNTQHGSAGGAGGMGANAHLEQARKLLYAKNSAEGRNVASFMRLTNYAWSGISFALLFAFSMSALYKYFKKPEQQDKGQIDTTH